MDYQSMRTRAKEGVYGTGHSCLQALADDFELIYENAI